MKNIKSIKKILCLLGLILLVFFILKHFNLIEGMSSDYSFNREFFTEGARKLGKAIKKVGNNAAKKGGGGKEDDNNITNIYIGQQ